MEKNYFQVLYDIDVSDRTYKKKDLTYLSWASAIAEVKKIYPDMQYEIIKFGDAKLPYTYDPNTGYLVYTTVTINGITHEMCLPVMDGANKPMKAEPYKYTTKFGDKDVEAASMFDINKTIMRCLTKNIAVHGLGLFIYEKDEIPQSVSELEELRKELFELAKSKSAIDNEKVKELCEIAHESANPMMIEDLEKAQELKKGLLKIRATKKEKEVQNK
jgi:hypothetical protein